MTNKIIDGALGVPTYENGCLIATKRGAPIFEDGKEVGYRLERPNTHNNDEDQEFTTEPEPIYSGDTTHVDGFKVSNRQREFICESQDDAEWLCMILNNR